MKKIIATTNAPAAIGPYSQAIDCGSFLVTSGQVPFDPKTGEFVPGGIQEQTRQVLTNVKAILEAAGLTPVTLPAQLQRVVMSIIYDEIKKGETGSREKFGEIDAYLRQAGCDCAILGCTELSVYRSLHSLPPYYIDAMEILAEQAILRCGKALRNV